MNATLSGSSSPLGESQTVARRKRLAHLAFMVFKLMFERFQGGTLKEFDGAESAGLIDALRVCSTYTENISCLNMDDVFIIHIEGVDNQNYIMQFSLFDPNFSLVAGRVRVTNLSLLAGQEGRKDSSSTTLDVLNEYTERLKLGKMSIDRAFLIGMSIIIGLIDEQDEGQDGRLGPLIRWITPSREELGELRAKLPPSTISYDDEGEPPF